MPLVFPLWFRHNVLALPHAGTLFCGPTAAPLTICVSTIGCPKSRLLQSRPSLTSMGSHLSGQPLLACRTGPSISLSLALAVTPSVCMGRRLGPVFWFTMATTNHQPMICGLFLWVSVATTWTTHMPFSRQIVIVCWVLSSMATSVVGSLAPCMPFPLRAQLPMQPWSLRPLLGE